MLGGRGQRYYRCLIWLCLSPVLVGSCSRVPAESEEELYRKAALSLQQGDLKQAELRIEQGTGEWRGRPESIWHWHYRMLNAELLLTQGRTPEALVLVDSQLPEIPEVATLTARWKTVRANTLLRAARADEARRLLDEAEAWASGNGQQDLLPKIQVNRGQVLAFLKRAEDADQEFRSALKHAEELNDFYYQAAALNNLGLSLIRNSRFDAAIPLLERSLAAARHMGARLVESAAMTNIGLCSRRLGDFDRALASFEEAVKTQEAQGAQLYLQASLGELGNTYVFQNQPQRAIPYYRRALDLAREINVPADASKWSGNLAVALIDVQDWNQAEKLNQESITLKERIRDSAALRYSRLVAADIAAGRGQYEKAEGLYEETIRSSADSPPVLWEAHAGLAKLFKNTGNDLKASEHFETAIEMIEAASDELAAGNYQITLLARLIGFYQDYVDALVDKQAYNKALQVVESSRARVLSQRLRLKGMANRSAAGSDYQTAAARSGSVLVSYWLAPKRSFLWVITPRSRQMFILPPQREIEAQVESYATFVQSLRDPMDADQSAADRLYQTLLAPARALIPTGSKVVVVPDGTLHNLNFETLPVSGEPRHYWIEDVTLSIAPSLDSQFESIPPRPPKSLLLIGDAEPAAKEFQKLPYAGREIRSIEQRLPALQKAVYQGAQARPAAYRESQPRSFSIIHFAAHAVANRESPLDSAIILSPGSGSFKLYARDLLDLPLNADLVTISSCRSAGARIYSGEGLVGFAWAFLQVGARHVIAGLWDVNDSSTAELMDKLYAGIASGSPPADALRAAKLALIHSTGNFRKPYYWGPFQIYVGGTPVR